VSHHAINRPTAIAVVANRSGSVIGVACRYNTFGFNAKMATAARLAAADPVNRLTIHESAQAAAANDRIEIATPDAPVR
jgi:hypothetical protein